MISNVSNTLDSVRVCGCVYDYLFCKNKEIGKEKTVNFFSIFRSSVTV